MSIRTLELYKIVEDLNNNPTIAAVLPGGIYFGEKGRDDNKDANAIPTYCNTTIVSDTPQRNGVQKKARVQFTFVANRTIAPASLQDIVNIVTNEIVSYRCEKKYTFTDTANQVDSITIDDIRESTMYGPKFDDYNRVVFIKDFTFLYRHKDG